MKSFKELFESVKCTQKAKDFINQLDSMEQQVLRMKILDRSRTNYDPTWNKEYFYGSMKQKSKDDAKWLANIFTKYDSKGVKEEELAACFTGGDPKKYFDGLK